MKIKLFFIKILMFSLPIALLSCPSKKDDNTALLLLLLLFQIQNETCTNSFYTDPAAAPANRVDVVITGDGYTSADLTKFENDAQNMLRNFVNTEPFKEYCNYFNFHLVKAASVQSGADHPEKNIYVDTLFDSTYNCQSTQRLVCVSNSKVYNYLNNNTKLNPLNQQDIILVIVNDLEYGGSGGALSVASANSSSAEIAVHEIGHSFGLLADEYDYGTCSTVTEPTQVNVTIETNPALIKWNDWISPGTAIPTTSAIDALPGLYAGAKYCPSGVYRPTYNSKMRNLARPFEQINEEQLVKRIYNFVSPVDAVIPGTASIALGSGNTQEFKVSVMNPKTNPIQINWYLDNILQKDSSNLKQLTLSGSTLSSGAHILRVDVSDTTFKVKKDPSKVLQDSFTWNIQVN